MMLHFNAEGLQQVRVEGDAVLESRLVREAGDIAVNSVKGEEMDIYFAEGLLVRVEVGPQAEGHIPLPQRMYRSGVASRQCSQAIWRPGGG